MPVLSVIGLVFFAGGFFTIFSLLATKGALNKSKQLGMIGEILDGRHGRETKRALALAFFALLFGACTTFTGFMQRDAARRSACKKECVRRGYAKGTIQGSREKTKGRHAFVACTCTGGADDDLELRADSIE